MLRMNARVSVLMLCGGVAAGCVSSSSGPSLDAAPPDLDVVEPDSGTTASDSGLFADAHDATVPVDSSVAANDGATPSDASDGGGPEAAADGGVPDATADATPPDAAADAASPDSAGAQDAADSGTGDAGPGTVTSPLGLRLTVARQGHSATLLHDGRVLFCGGYYTEVASLASCDIFDPTTTTISAGPSMVYGRQYASATVLPDGEVLMAGGTGPQLPDGGGSFGLLQNAEIFDPVANTFTAVSTLMQVARAGQAAVLLAAPPTMNQVLLLGGAAFVPGVGNTATATAELFDPGDAATAGTFTLLKAQMHVARSFDTAAVLDGGSVFVTGGSFYADASAAFGETIDPALNAFQYTPGAMSTSHEEAVSTPLLDGRIFVAGGQGEATCDIFDPAVGLYTTVTPPLARWEAPVTTLKSGRVLLAGGIGASESTLGDVVVYDPVARQFAEANGSLSVPRSIATATTLQDGRVIIAGGQDGMGMVVGTVDIFTE